MNRRRLFATGATAFFVAGCERNSEQVPTSKTDFTRPFASKLGELHVAAQNNSGLYKLTPRQSLIEQIPMQIDVKDFPIDLNGTKVETTIRRTNPLIMITFNLNPRDFIGITIRPADMYNAHELFLAWINGKFTDAILTSNNGKATEVQIYRNTPANKTI